MLTLFGHDLSGPTTARPPNAEICQPFYDTTLGAFIVWNGSSWSIVSAMVGSSINITNPATNQITSFNVRANGSGAANLRVETSDGTTGVIIFSSTAGITVTGLPTSLDSGLIQTDGSGNLTAVSLTLSALLSATPQFITTTGSVPITSSNVVCTGSGTTAPKLPAPAANALISVKNKSSATCTINADGASPVSDIIAKGGVTTATTLALTTGQQALLMADGTNWNQIA